MPLQVLSSTDICPRCKPILNFRPSNPSTSNSYHHAVLGCSSPTDPQPPVPPSQHCLRIDPSFPSRVHLVSQTHRCNANLSRLSLQLDASPVGRRLTPPSLLESTSQLAYSLYSTAHHGSASRDYARRHLAADFCPQSSQAQAQFPRLFAHLRLRAAGETGRGNIRVRIIPSAARHVKWSAVESTRS